MGENTGLKRVALSGGVFQNMLLLKKSVDILEREGFEVFIHRRVPTNDGGISLGQAAAAAELLNLEVGSYVPGGTGKINR